MGENRQPGKANKKKRLTVAIVVMLLLAFLCALFLITHKPWSGDNGPSGNDAGSGAVSSGETGSEEAEPEEAKASETLVFASDYQEKSGWDDPSETLTAILRKIKDAGKTPTNIIYCGDYTNDPELYDYQLAPDDSINEIRDIAAKECGSVSQKDMIFVQGNHDSLTDAISSDGLHEYDNYLVYVLNTQYKFPWKQGRDPARKDVVISASEEMKECFDELIARGETRPLFITGHVPLHFTARTSSMHNTGDNMYASYIFDVVNEAGRSLDIVYVFGHNHSKGWDCYQGGSSSFFEPGEEVLIPEAGDNTAYTDEFTSRELSFTYMNAGYTGYYLTGEEPGSYEAADETLTMTTCEIMPDELIITRFSEEGEHPLRWKGEGNPYKGGIDAGLIGSEYYSKRKDSPVHIKRKSV